MIAGIDKCNDKQEKEKERRIRSCEDSRGIPSNNSDYELKVATSKFFVTV